MKKEITAIITDKNNVSTSDQDIVISPSPDNKSLFVYCGGSHYFFPKNMKVVLKNARTPFYKIFKKLLDEKIEEHCPLCNDTGVIETGNNDLPCKCPKGDTAEFNDADYGRVTGAFLKGK